MVARKRRIKSSTKSSVLEEWLAREREQRRVANAELLRKLSDKYRSNGLVLVVGSGVSKSIDLPTWRELLSNLRADVAADLLQASVDVEVSDREWNGALNAIEYQANRAGGSELILAREIKDHFKGDFEKSVQNRLYQSIRGPLKRSQLPRSELFAALTWLCRAHRSSKGIRAVVNYNFDCLLESYLKKDRQSVSPIAGPGGRRDDSDGLPMYHVHGYLPDPNSSAEVGRIVFSEDDYQELYRYQLSWSTLIQLGLMTRYSCLFVGLSMNDPNLRRLLNVSHELSPKVRHVALLSSRIAKGEAATKASTGLLERAGANSLAQLGVDVVWFNGHRQVPAAIRSIVDV